MTFNRKTKSCISATRRRHNRIQAMKISLISTCAIGLAIVLFLATKTIYDSAEAKNKELYDNMQNSIIQLSDKVNSLTTDIESLRTENAQLTQEIENMTISLEEIKGKLAEVSVEPNDVPTTGDPTQTVDRDQLAEKYKFVMYDWKGDPTDVTIELVEYGYKLMVEKGLNPDLLFAIIDVESSGNAKDVNSSSSASGLGQFMPGTGKYIYEDVLKLGTYDHKVTPFDPKVNVLMIVTYLDILSDKKDGNVKEMMRSYCGAGSNNTALEKYYQKLVNVLGYEP